MRLKNIKTIIVITLLIALNLLLYKNVEYQNQVETLSSQIRSWSYESLDNGNVRISHPKIKLPNSGLSLLVFFTDRGCQSCIEYEIRNLNEFYNKYEKHIRVYIISNNESYIKRIGTTFPFELINPQDAILDNEFDFTNPVALLTDANGMVQYINVAEVGNPGKSSRFYQRMSSLFESTIQ